MKKILRIIKNELLHILVWDRRRGILLLFASVAYMMVFSWLYYWGVVQGIPLLVVDQSNTVLSRQLVQNFAYSDGFRLVGESQSLADAEVWLQKGRHGAALYIPPDFAEKIQSRKQSELVMAMEGSNLILTSNGSIAAAEILREFNAKAAQNTLARDKGQLPGQARQRTAPVHFNYRLLNNPQLDYLIFFVYGLALVALQQGVLLAVAAGVLWPSNKHVAEELELGKYACWGVKTVTYWLLGMLSYALCLAVGWYCFSLPVGGSWLQHLLLGCSFVFCLVQVGGMIAGMCKEELLFSRISIFYTVPAFMLSGYTWPLEAMPLWVQNIAQCSPFTYLASAVRQLCLSGNCHDLWQRALVLLLLGIICLPGAAHLYQQRLRSIRSNTSA
ncbi:MAG: ABC transporter permease [Phascolarctobacterium sp.]